MMRDAIKNFSKQFAFGPVVENAEKLKQYEGFIMAGMGGSHLVADLLRVWKPELDVTVHSDYGFPTDLKPEWLERMLFIASSYSGNTEETLDAYEEAGKKGMARAAIAVGGKLLARAKEDGVPFVQIPDTGIQPRLALGFSLKAFFKILGEENTLVELTALAQTFQPTEYESPGKELAERLKGFVPVIYASRRNSAIAYNWKIKFNETGKIPAFMNVFPELNHNEMTGFDVAPSTAGLSRHFYFIFLKDPADDERIVRRMTTTAQLYSDRGLPVEVVEISGVSIFEKIFSSLLLADWAAYYTAEGYGVESEEVPMVEEFKKLIA